MKCRTQKRPIWTPIPTICMPTVKAKKKRRSLSAQEAEIAPAKKNGGKKGMRQNKREIEIKRRKEEGGESPSEEEKWKLRNYERMRKNEEAEKRKDEEKRSIPAFKGGQWQKNVLLNQIGGEECILDTKPVAKGSRLMSARKLAEEDEAPIPEDHPPRTSHRLCPPQRKRRRTRSRP